MGDASVDAALKVLERGAEVFAQVAAANPNLATELQWCYPPHHHP